MDAFRERVKKAAQDAVDDQLGEQTDSDPAPSQTLSPSEIASRGWSLSEYNDFFADCRREGYGASECGSMWSAAKEAGMVGGSSVKPAESGSDDDANHDDESRHVLVLKEGAESSDLTAQYLADPIVDGEIDVVDVESDVAQNMLGSVDDVPAVPAHLMVIDGEVEVRELESLFDEYADAP